MGGSGSGNWYRYDSKTIAEHCCSIDVRQLSRGGCLKPWLKYPLKWNNGSNIIVETKPDAIDLSYGISRNEQPREDVRIIVPLSWSSCNYGGNRPWFICPGKGCGRRVAKLYLAGKYFLCRHCHNLTYSIQRQSKAFRLLDKAEKIYQRLGANNCNDLVTTSKPKGMHWRTYEGLVEEAQKAEDESLYEICQKLKDVHRK
jgi:hypothetical protein